MSLKRTPLVIVAVSGPPAVSPGAASNRTNNPRLAIAETRGPQSPSCYAADCNDGFGVLCFFRRPVLVPVRASPVPSVVRGSFVVKFFRR